MINLTPYRNRRVVVLTDRGVVVTGLLISWAATGRRTVHVLDDTDTDRFIPRASVVSIEMLPEPVAV